MSCNYRNNYDAISWDTHKKRKRSVRASGRKAHYVIKDIDPFRSPVDGSYVTSRSELREHEKKHNVRQIGNDWAGSERPPNWDTINNVNN